MFLVLFPVVATFITGSGVNFVEILCFGGHKVAIYVRILNAIYIFSGDWQVIGEWNLGHNAWLVLSKMTMSMLGFCNPMVPCHGYLCAQLVI